MAVAFVGQSIGGTGAGTTSTYSYTGSGSTNGYMIAGAINSSSQNLTGVTYNGVAMTSLLNTSLLDIFGLVAPASGAHNLSFTIATYDSQVARCNVAEFSGVDQTTPAGTAVSATGTGSGTGAVNTGSITVPANGMAAGFGRHQYSPAAMTIDQGTLLGSTQVGAVALAGAYRSTTGSLSWTPNNSALWQAGGVPLNPASSGSSVSPGVGAMVFAGLAPTLTVSSNRTVSPGVGALSLAGLAPQPGLPFNSSTYEFGQRTGLTLSDYAIFASTSLNVSVYADSDLLLATRLFAYTETTSSIGRLSFKTNAALAAGTTYFFVARDATGLLCGCGRITAAP